MLALGRTAITIIQPNLVNGMAADDHEIIAPCLLRIGAWNAKGMAELNAYTKGLERTALERLPVPLLEPCVSRIQPTNSCNVHVPRYDEVGFSHGRP